jgi:hypothetical protein
MYKAVSNVSHQSATGKGVITPSPSSCSTAVEKMPFDAWPKFLWPQIPPRNFPWRIPIAKVIVSA